MSRFGSNQDACHSFASFQRTQERPQRRLASNLFVCLDFTRRRHGGASRDRTDDPLLAKQVLSQLSYGPMPDEESAHGGAASCAGGAQVMVGLGGLEPPASPLSGVRSNHLSYRPGKLSWDAT